MDDAEKQYGSSVRRAALDQISSSSSYSSSYSTPSSSSSYPHSSSHSSSSSSSYSSSSRKSYSPSADDKARVYRFPSSSDNKPEPSEPRLEVRSEPTSAPKYDSRSELRQEPSQKLVSDPAKPDSSSRVIESLPDPRSELKIENTPQVPEASPAFSAEPSVSTTYEATNIAVANENKAPILSDLESRKRKGTDNTEDIAAPKIPRQDDSGTLSPPFYTIIPIFRCAPIYFHKKANFQYRPRFYPRQRKR